MLKRFFFQRGKKETKKLCDRRIEADSLLIGRANEKDERRRREKKKKREKVIIYAHVFSVYFRIVVRHICHSFKSVDVQHIDIHTSEE